MGTIAAGLFLVGVVQAKSADVLYTSVLPMVFMFVSGSYIYLVGAQKELDRMGPVCALLLALIQFVPGIFAAIGHWYGIESRVLKAKGVYMKFVRRTRAWRSSGEEE